MVPVSTAIIGPINAESVGFLLPAGILNQNSTYHYQIVSSDQLNGYDAADGVATEQSFNSIKVFSLKDCLSRKLKPRIHERGRASSSQRFDRDGDQGQHDSVHQDRARAEKVDRGCVHFLGDQTTCHSH